MKLYIGDKLVTTLVDVPFVMPDCILEKGKDILMKTHQVIFECDDNALVKTGYKHGEVCDITLDDDVTLKMRAYLRRGETYYFKTL